MIELIKNNYFLIVLLLEILGNICYLINTAKENLFLTTILNNFAKIYMIFSPYKRTISFA